jgi:hypothetical protein
MTIAPGASPGLPSIRPSVFAFRGSSLKRSFRAKPRNAIFILTKQSHISRLPTPQTASYHGPDWIMSLEQREQAVTVGAVAFVPCFAVCGFESGPGPGC